MAHRITSADLKAVDQKNLKQWLANCLDASLSEWIQYDQVEQVAIEVRREGVLKWGINVIPGNGPKRYFQIQLREL